MTLWQSLVLSGVSVCVCVSQSPLHNHPHTVYIAWIRLTFSNPTPNCVGIHGPHTRLWVPPCRDSCPHITLLTPTMSGFLPPHHLICFIHVGIYAPTTSYLSPPCQDSCTRTILLTPISLLVVGSQFSVCTVVFSVIVQAAMRP